MRKLPGFSALLYTVVFFVVILPSILILLYPLKFLRKLLCCKWLYRSRSLWFFMEAFQGHYRGGTDGKCMGFQWAALLQFVNRIVAIITLVNMWNSSEAPTIRYFYIIVLYLMGVSLFYSLVRPYSRAYMNILEGFLYGFAAMVLLNIISLSAYFTPRQGASAAVYTDILLVVMVMPSVVLAVLLLYRVVCLVVRKVRVGRGRESEGTNNSSEGIPNQMLPEEEDTPLLPTN